MKERDDLEGQEEAYDAIAAAQQHNPLQKPLIQ